ncbi:MAG: Sporulation kinase E [Syntrophus sp. PtaB.Bin001]|nr:MAG: Sporulation kinase E [Syntrophus sp. PtaB.Bin001]
MFRLISDNVDVDAEVTVGDMKFEHLQHRKTKSPPVPLSLDTPDKEKPGEKSLIDRLPEADPGKLRLVLDCLDAGACVIDMETCEILYMNSYGQRIFGDVEGKICWQTLQKNQNGPCPFCNNRQLLNEQGQPAEAVVWEIQNTRNNRWYECRDRALYWFGGCLARLEIAADITERKREEENHIRMMKLEALRILGEGLVCDSNDLLSAGMGYMSLARLHLTPDNPAFWFLEKAKDALMKTGEFNKRLLTLTGNCSPFLREAALDSLLLDSVHLFPGDPKVKNAFILADPLWPVLIDEDQIRQVIFHLLRNARQAMPEGGNLKIRAENVSMGPGEKGRLPSGPYVRLSIEDQGIGIPPDRLSRIFSAGIEKEPGMNTQKLGLGLAVCRSIIEKHHGHIECRSKPGEGTTFTVYLPAVKIS